MPENKTLRDEFAIATLNGLYAKVGTSILPKHQPTVALVSYSMADAMMIQRAKPVEPPKTKRETEEAEDEDAEFHRILNKLIEDIFSKK